MQTFPSLIGRAWPVTRTPEWDTDVQVSLTGKRTTLGRRSFPVWRYKLVHNVLRAGAQKEWQKLAAFWNVVGGRRDVFRFHDEADGDVAAMGFGAGDGATAAFQLTRAFGDDEFAFVEPVFAPADDVQIFVDGVLQTVTTDYAIGPTGIVTFTSPPASAALLTWTGSFDWLCRFDTDSVDFEQFYFQFWRLGEITFSTEKF